MVTAGRLGCRAAAHPETAGNTRPEGAMRKIRLELEKLSIDSFDTGAEGAKGRGTVIGNVKVTDIRYCGSGYTCYTDNEPECGTNWYGCNTQQCSRTNCTTIEGVDCN